MLIIHLLCSLDSTPFFYFNFFGWSHSFRDTEGVPRWFLLFLSIPSLHVFMGFLVLRLTVLRLVFKIIFGPTGYFYTFWWLVFIAHQRLFPLHCFFFLISRLLFIRSLISFHHFTSLFLLHPFQFTGERCFWSFPHGFLLFPQSFA